MTKQQAIEILNAKGYTYAELYIEALDRAGLFMSEETAAELAIAVRDVYANEEILDGELVSDCFSHNGERSRTTDIVIVGRVATTSAGHENLVAARRGYL